MYERENARRLILIGIVIVVIVIVAALFFALRGSGSSSPSKGSTAAVVPVTVVVASQAVPQGTQLSVSQVPTYFKQTTVPNTAVPSDAFSTLDQLRGVITGAPNGTVTATQTIYQNAAVVPGMFTTVGLYRTGQTPAFVIPYGYDAEAVSFDTLNSVLGSINAGDNIDIMASFKGRATTTGPNGLGSLNPPPQTQFVLTDLRVLSVNAPPPVAGGTQPVTVSATPTAVPATAPAAGGTLLVLVRYEQALELQHLKDFGWDISAVLRSAKQQTIPHLKTLPVTDKWFFVKTQTPLRQNPGY